MCVCVCGDDSSFLLQLSVVNVQRSTIRLTLMEARIFAARM